MSSINQSYYAFIKAHMSRLGIWPEQSIYVKIIRSLGMFMTITFVGPLFVRLYNVSKDVDTVIIIIAQLMTGIVFATAIWNSMLQVDKMNVMIENMERHWTMIKNTSTIFVLDKYAERGVDIAIIFSILAYITLAIYLAIPTLPVVLDFLAPLNETRPKNYIYEGEYGVDPDKYYWLILAHGYGVSIAAVNMFLAIEIIYILFVEHACGLFQVVGFSGMIESLYSGSFAVGIGTTTILISITSAQILMNLEHPEILIRLASFTIGQIFILYCNTIPGQRLIDHSRKVHEFAYHLDWYDISVKAQHLLILILIRSNKPCRLTAGKVYIISMECFGSVIQTAVSYFMVLAQLL